MSKAEKTAEANSHSPDANQTQLLFRRLGRKLLWPRPNLYRWVGRLRNRGDCLNLDFDVWIYGFPRSGNSFTAEFFKMANPDARIAVWNHIPAFVISAIQARKPGLFLLRKPEDAVISWSIFGKGDLGRALDYYMDFHDVLKPHASRMLVAPFERVTSSFPDVIDEFNRRFGVKYNAMPNDPEAVADCFSRVEGLFRTPDGAINEMRVGRPSGARELAKAALLERLHHSPHLARKLAKANEFYSHFRAVHTNGAHAPKFAENRLMAEVNSY
jgi:hypothetical protein